MGVVVVLAPDRPSLVALVSLTAAVILSGNTAIVVASGQSRWWPSRSAKFSPRAICPAAW